MKDRRALREQIDVFLREGDFSGLVDLAGREPALARYLLLYLYAPDDIRHWRAVEGLGHVAGAHPQQVQKLIGRLLYLLNEDSGSSGWGAAAALGEIGRHQISLVAEIIPMFFGFLEEEFSRGPMLWGLGRLGEAHSDRIAEALPLIASFLTQGDAQVRALSAWCLGKVRYRGATEALTASLADASPVTLYDCGELRRTTVSQVAKEALAALDRVD